MEFNERVFTANELHLGTKYTTLTLSNILRVFLLRQLIFVIALINTHHHHFSCFQHQSHARSTHFQSEALNPLSFAAFTRSLLSPPTISSTKPPFSHTAQPFYPSTLTFTPLTSSELKLARSVLP